MNLRLGGPRSVSTGLALVVVAAATTVALAVPSEVANLGWCPGPKNCLQWDPVAGATQYRIYRGERLSLPCVINSAFDSCDHGTVFSTSTGATVTEVPSPGGSFWFLVTAADGGGEGPYGSATVGPRESQHNGSCAPTCSPAGAICSVSGDCCSASCIGARCQTACCIGTGGACSQNPDCCSGRCSTGQCQAPCTPNGGLCASGGQCCSGSCAASACQCTPLGSACTRTSQCCSGTCSAGICQNYCGDGAVDGSEQCDDHNNLSGDGCGATCTGETGYVCSGSPSVCTPCSAGHANCNGTQGDGCECPSNICCFGGCQPPHMNGIGQSFDSCDPLGVPGNPATYTAALASAARAAWPFAGTDFPATCGGAGAQAAARQTATSCAVWVYTSTLAGYVHRSPNHACVCPTNVDPTWR